MDLHGSHFKRRIWGPQEHYLLLPCQLQGWSDFTFPRTEGPTIKSDQLVPKGAKAGHPPEGSLLSILFPSLGKWTIVKDLKLTEQVQKLMKVTGDELVEERKTALGI